ncbi:3-hydroxyisobutyrate dehydrogenase [Rhizobium helianthi]|uniref:3-hydroxyisobutyrate dehydrogenase n=1 Tax=Rhizobium helianthi TaxID=1132695 RepID=A0ABW4M0D7_9HYPH
MTDIAFIGLGNMGGPMAANLVKAGHKVRGFDLSEQSRQAAEATGVSCPADLAAAVAGASVVITMLPKGEHVLSVWGDLKPMLEAGTLLIDCSTIDVDSARKAHEIAADAKCHSLDAPVSGGISGASQATLTFMAGGEQKAYDAANPILQAMGRRIVHCGGPGAGQAAKICNNMLLGISMIGACEAFALGEKLGLTHQALFDVISTSSGQCWSVNTYCPVPGPVATSPANRDYQPGFAAALMLKDLLLSQDAASSVSVQTPLGQAAADLYRQFEQSGNGMKDFSGIIEMLRKA